MRFDDPEFLNWFKAAKCKDTCPFLTWECCKIPIQRTKQSIRKSHGKQFIACSTACATKLAPNYSNSKEEECRTCGKRIRVDLSHSKKHKNAFCSQSCAATYNNTHRTSGCRRSKLEIWLEEQLPIFYPNLEFHFNKKEAINSELDIYIPSLKLAIELNGIFHYEPIYGPDQLSKIQNNDNRKIQACIERGIEFCIMDTSKQKQFSFKSSQKYLDIIKGVIDKVMEDRKS